MSAGVFFQSRPRHRARVDPLAARGFRRPYAVDATRDDAAATIAPPRHRARVAARERVSRPGRDAVDAPPTQAKKVEGKSLDTQCGTPGYVAPEILKGKKYGTAVDMWSCGVIVYILLGGYPPFHDDNHAILYRKIKAADYAFDPQYWDQVSDDAKDLIKKMLVVDPDKRLTASQALRHPWFMVGDHELISRNLAKTLDTMKKFNARRKFKGKVKGIILANKLAKGDLF